MNQVRCDDCGEPMGWSDNLIFMCPICFTHYHPNLDTLRGIEERMDAFSKQADGYEAIVWAVGIAEDQQRLDPAKDYDQMPDMSDVIFALGLPTCEPRDILAWHMFRERYPVQIGVIQ